MRHEPDHIIARRLLWHAQGANACWKPVTLYSDSKGERASGRFPAIGKGPIDVTVSLSSLAVSLNGGGRWLLPLSPGGIHPNPSGVPVVCDDWTGCNPARAPLALEKSAPHHLVVWLPFSSGFSSERRRRPETERSKTSASAPCRAENEGHSKPASRRPPVWGGHALRNPRDVRGPEGSRHTRRELSAPGRPFFGLLMSTILTWKCAEKSSDSLIRCNLLLLLLSCITILYK